MQPDKKGWIQPHIFGWNMLMPTERTPGTLGIVERKRSPQFQSVGCGAKL
ncbi:hypothetical protein EXN66_Car011880 [Channa argus]|uniref:Uncharacterized protein n=1 Tax=Channa argus TaxID=215402 RepID=A0A6G1Q1D6_CHAAH|nr:hypothetical protein EXN66_Car011880 [Channa argus]